MRWRRVLAPLALTLGSLLALEGLCNLTEPAPKYRLSLSTGYELVPGLRPESGEAPETVNSDGLRGPELGPRVAGRLRILCMGESTTWGHKLANDETWPAQLQELLVARGQDVEVLNGGVSGWGLEQVVRALQDGLLRRLRPDVVLVYAGWNAPRLAGNRQVARVREAIARREHDPLLSRSALARWLDKALEGETTGTGTARREFATAAAEAFPALAPELRAACEAHGARLAFVRFPALAQRAPPARADVRAAFEALLLERAPRGDEAQELAREAAALHASLLAAVAAGAQAAGAPLLDAAGGLERRLPAERDAADALWTGWFKDALHLTPAGNRALAEALAGELDAAGLLARG